MDVNLELNCEGPREFNVLIQFLPKILPLVNGIESIELYTYMLARLQKKNFWRQMLTSARVLHIRSAVFLMENIFLSISKLLTSVRHFRF
jgi:hypothetical protein